MDRPADRYVKIQGIFKNYKIDTHIQIEDIHEQIDGRTCRWMDRQES